MLDPLGRSPVLDANENLAWAGLIADGQLPDEAVVSSVAVSLGSFAFSC